MKVEIIGAGVAGLASIRQTIKHDQECVAFERTEDVGGVWVYRDPSSIREQASFYQNPMYKSLRTNFPVQLMEFIGYEFKPESGLSYPGHEEVLKYINNFTRDYNLTQHIKFGREVVKVSRHNGTWKMVVRNLGEKKIEEYNFDAIMICTGYNEVPQFPNIPGMGTFTGYQIHGKEFKESSPFVGKSVLIIGVGATGRDFSYECSKVAKIVILCHRRKPVQCIREPNIIQKPEVTFIDQNIVNFKDGTSEEVDAIIYCTGYKYSFPFLDESCEVNVRAGRIVNPLYKYFLNINQPTMCFISLLQRTFGFALCDIQTEVFIKLLTNKIRRPSKDEMVEHLKSQLKEKEINEVNAFHYYYMDDQGAKDYMLDLCDMGHLKRLPEVLFAMSKLCRDAWGQNYKNLRNHEFQVIDDENFEYKEISS